MYQKIAAFFATVGLISYTFGNSPYIAAGAFVATGLFVIADIVDTI